MRRRRELQQRIEAARLHACPPTSYRTWMKVARKLAVALLAGISLVLVCNGYLRARREMSLQEADTQHDQHAMIRILVAAVSEVWASDGEERAMRLVQEVNDRETVTIRWVSLDGAVTEAIERPLSDELMASVRDGHEMVRRLPGHDGDELVTVAPVEVEGVRRGAIEVSETLTGKRELMKLLVLNTAAATGVLTVLCGAITLGLGMALIGRPLRQLMQQARRIGGGDLSSRLELRQSDEIGELAAEMNAMCEKLVEAREAIRLAARGRIEAQEQLRHADRLATVGKLASGIAHELGAPLQVISGRARMIFDGDLGRGEMSDNARIIHEQTHRMAATIRQLLDFARRKGSERVSVDLREFISKTGTLFAPLAARSGVELRIEDRLASSGDDQASSVNADPEQLQQVIANLVLNAVQSMPEGGDLRIRLRSERVKPPADIGREEGSYLCFDVEDTGHGVAPDDIAHIFEPFFTTKDVGEGTGLGLAVAYGIVRDHGGWVAVRSQPQLGSCFSIYLPSGALS